MVDVPQSASGLTAAWLNSALAAGGQGDFADITDLAMQRVGEGVGVMTEIYRLTPTYSSSGRPGPRTMIAKIHAAIPEVRAVALAYGFYHRETVFYRDIAGKAGMRAPVCYATACDPDGERFVLVLEDVGGAQPGDQIAGLTVRQLDEAVSQAASLHATWWGSPELAALQNVIQPFGEPPYVEFSARHSAAWAVMHPFLKGRVSAAMMRVGERMGETLDGIIAQIHAGPRTLCHGDFRADNLMFTRDGEALTGLIALDWQIAMQGAGPFDIGYLMSGSVEPEIRREHEITLLRRYHDKLLAGGVSGYDFEQCRHDYRRALLVGFTYCVQGGAPNDLTVPRTEALFDRMARRCEAAVNDHGLEEFLH